ncbi:MAG: hypothetical protein DYG88_00215 [Chloroflexi bacterium CFX4]|nr:hypothetical protein [Chloroflexi bacterium CFX4]MDL1921677.1 hypothetical protein [Chloroflexi bacterium CFX3]
MRKLAACLVVLMLVVGFTIPFQSASADAYVKFAELTCSSFKAVGSSDAPYVILFVYEYNTAQVYWVALPVIDGSYGGKVVFPEQQPGTMIDYYVWGAPEPDYNSFDRGAYYNTLIPCTI